MTIGVALADDWTMIWGSSFEHCSITGSEVLDRKTVGRMLLGKPIRLSRFHAQRSAHSSNQANCNNAIYCTPERKAPP